jgi:pseudomonalisin
MRRLLVLARCSVFLALSYSIAQTIHPVDRILAVPDDTRTVKLAGNTHPLARPAYDVGAASPSYRMDRMILVLDPSDDQKQALDALSAAQQDPASAGYQKWLTPEQFADQFGVSKNDVDQVTAWLGGHGFTIDEVPAGRRTIVFSGTAQMVQTAFHTQMRQYRVNGAVHVANSSDPEIPEAFATVVAGTSTLHDFGRTSLRTPKRKVGKAVPDFSSGGSYYLAPADFAMIYNLNPLYAAGNDGTGKSIAIVGRTNINLSDVETFRSYFGLPVNNPQIIVNGTNPGITDDVDEAVLDVEWSGAVGRGATVKFVVSASTGSTDGVDLSAQYIVTNNIAPVMSTSYGTCEAAMGTAELAFYNHLWQQAAAQGISTMISAGDSGAALCDAPSETTAVDGKAINGLCSSIYSVCVGGTEFNDASSYGTYWLSSMNAGTKESAISYIPEMAWNQSGSVSGGSDLWATGGGASAIYAKPPWQAGPGVPADGKRDVPDVSLAAATHDGFLVVEGGDLWVIGGTSASSPSFAGIMALVNQKTGSAQGNPNPTLYELAALETNHTTAHSYFHDITSASNSVPGVTGYNAGTGYDLATGLGTVNANDLVNFWHDAAVGVQPSMTAAMSVGSLTIRQGGSGTSTATISIAGGYNSAVTLAVSGAPAGITATLASASLLAPGSGSSLLTIAIGATAIPGSATITVTATGGSLTSTGIVQLTIVPAFTLATNLTTVSVQQGASLPLTLTSAIASGFSGAVVLTARSSEGTALPTGVTVGFAPSTIAAPGSGTSTLAIAAANSAAPGVYSIMVTGTSGSVTNKASFAVTVTSPPSFKLTAAPSSVTAAPGTSASTTISMTPGSGFSSSVTLSTSSLPSGITVQFASTSIGRAGGNVTMTAKVASTVEAGSYPITVTGTGGVSPSPTVVITLVVSGFRVTATSATASLLPSASVLVPITTSVTSGFSGVLNLTVTGLPSGVTAIFTPPTIDNPAGGSSSMRLTASEAVQSATKALTITATSAAGAVETSSVSLTVR